MQASGNQDQTGTAVLEGMRQEMSSCTGDLHWGHHSAAAKDCELGPWTAAHFEVVQPRSGPLAVTVKGEFGRLSWHIAVSQAPMLQVWQPGSVFDPHCCERRQSMSADHMSLLDQPKISRPFHVQWVVASSSAGSWQTQSACNTSLLTFRAYTFHVPLARCLGSVCRGMLQRCCI